MTEQLLELFTIYGLPTLFFVLIVGSSGIPFPSTLLLIVAGSFVAQGEMELWHVLAVGIVGAVLGDLVGYGLGRWGGRRLVRKISSRFGGDEKIVRAEQLTVRWGGAGIFLTRWLITPLGPWLNLTSGITCYPWKQFIVWVILGEIIWVALYVMVGKQFSDRVQDLADISGNLVWVIIGVLATVVLGWKLFQYLRDHNDQIEVNHEANR